MKLKTELGIEALGDGAVAGAWIEGLMQVMA